MKYCVNHPDRERFKRYKHCRECVMERKKQLQKKYTASMKETWVEVNLKDLLDDARSGRLNIKQLAQRYRICDSSVVSICKNNGITPKPVKTFCGKKINDMTRGTGHVSDMTRACGTIFPKHSFY